MKCVVVLAALVCLAQAFPQHGGYGGGSTNGNSQKCRVINSVEYEEIEEEKCTPYSDNVCTQKTRQQCNPYQEEVCKSVTRRQCSQKTRRECKQAYRTVSEPYTDTVCKDEWVNECAKSWQETGYGQKEWLDDPSTCKDLKKTVCNDVQKSRPRKEPYEDCQQVPYQDCRNVPHRECNNVQRTKCTSVPYNDCKRVTKQRCEPFHQKIPKQVQRRVCPGDADWPGSNNGDYDNYDEDYESGLQQGGGGGYDAVSVDAAFGVKASSSGKPKTKPALRGGAGGDEEKYEDSRIVFGGQS